MSSPLVNLLKLFLQGSKIVIPEDQKSTLIEIRIEAFNQKIKGINEQLVSGKISLTDWELLYRSEIKTLHTGCAAIGKGTWEEMTFRDWGIVGNEVKKQYNFLHQWALELEAKIAAGEDISLELLNVRGSLYGASGRASFERTKASLFEGLPAMPAYPGDGTTRCYTNCKCFWDYIELSTGNFDCFWTLGIADHCETCETRAAVWSPLLVRDSILVSQTDFPGVFR